MSSSNDGRHTTILNSLILPLRTKHLALHNQTFTSTSTSTAPPSPLIIGLSGVQGCGKTTLTTKLYKSLTSPPHSLSIAIFSIDDLYLPHHDLTTLSNSPTSPSSSELNPLLKYRGNPGTHDVSLGLKVLGDLKNQKKVNVPVYDKSLFNGAGDRLPEDQWVKVSPPYDVIILEGWCVGFRSLPDDEVKAKWEESRSRLGQPPQVVEEKTYLGKYKLEDLLWMNSRLREYHALWDQFSALIHIDAQSLRYIPRWRLQQEHALLATKGTGMTDQQVLDFVDMYMPAYELYVSGLRELESLGGAVDKGERRSNAGVELNILHMVIGENREVIKVEMSSS